MNRRGSQGRAVDGAAAIAVIVAGSLAWATIRTAYFRRSLRVRNTFRPP